MIAQIFHFTDNHSGIFLKRELVVRQPTNWSEGDSMSAQIYTRQRSSSTLEREEVGRFVASGNLVQLKLFQQQKKVKVHDWVDVGTSHTLLHLAAASNQATMILFLTSNATFSWINSQDTEGNTALHVAVMNGNIEATKALLDSGIDDSIKNDNGESALHVAIKQGSKAVQLVKLIVEHSAVHLLVEGCQNASTLHLSAKHSNTEAFKLIYMRILEASSEMLSCKLLVRDKSGASIMHVAARFGAYSIIEFLLSVCSDLGYSNEDFLDILSYDQKYPLHFAVEGNHIESVQCMLQHGADCTKSGGNNFSPVHMACSQDKLAILKAMVNVQGKEILKSRSHNGQTLLHSSVFSICSKDLIFYLLENGLGIDDQDDDGLTPLAQAIVLGSTKATEILLMKGANPVIKNTQGCNALLLSVAAKKLEVLKKVIALGNAEILVKDANNNGTSPIHLAIELGLNDMVEPLLALVDHFPKDGTGNNYLHLAALSGSTSTLLHVLSMPMGKFMTNECNSMGFTPLHYASAGASLAVVQNLLDHGASSHRNNMGHTPFMLACRNGNLEIAQLLLSENYFLKDWTDFEENSALHLAVEGKNPQIITYCLDEDMLIKLNANGLTFFDLILQSKDKKLAEAALKHSRWAEYGATAELHKPHPLLCLIDRIPDAYNIVLDQCFTTSGHEISHTDYWEEYNFVGVNTSLCQACSQGTVVSSGNCHIAMESRQLHHEDGQLSSNFVPSKRHPNPFDIISKLIENNHEQYLLHPVIAAFINSRWKGFGQYYYYSRFFFIILLAFLSIILAVVTPLSQQASPFGNETCSRSNTSERIAVLLYLSVLVSLINLVYLFIHVIVHYNRLTPYFFRNIMAWTTLIAPVCTIIYAVSVIVNGSNCSLTGASAVGVCFAWFSVGFSMQLIRFYNIGVYVTIVMNTTRSVFGILLIMSVFIIALGVPLHILAGSIDIQFSSIGIGLFSTLGYLVGLTDYQEIVMNEVQGSLRYSFAIFFLLTVIIIILPIVLINVLLGLVLGDIARIQEDALITHRKFEIVALAVMEKLTFIQRIFKDLSKARHKHYPNRKNGVSKIIFYLTELNYRANISNSYNQNPAHTRNDLTQEKEHSEIKQL